MINKYMIGGVDLIQYFKDGNVNVIIHQCNCFNTMRSGIAKAIATEFPLAKEVDSNTVKGDKGKLGSFSWCETEYGIVINLYSQYRYGRGEQHTDYHAMLNGLTKITKFLDDLVQDTDYNGTHYTPIIGTYELGCNRGGGDWSIVKRIIEETIAKEFEVHIVK